MRPKKFLMKKLKLNWKPKSKKNLTILHQRFQKVKSHHLRKKKRSLTYQNLKQRNGTRTLMMSILQSISQTKSKKTLITIATSILKLKKAMMNDDL